LNIIVGSKIKADLHFFLKKIFRKLIKKQKLKTFGVSNNEINIVYVINLDRQTNRWIHLRKEVQSQKLNNNKTLFDFCYRISAIDGKDINLTYFDSSEIKKSYQLTDQYYVDPDQKLLDIIRRKNISIDMTREEIAVALSHIKTWKKIVDEKRSYALILEDDIFFEDCFSYKLNEIWKELFSNNIELDLLYLSFREVDHGAEIKALSENLSKPIRGIWWLSGYILSYSGATKLLQELPMSGPIDLWLNHKFKKLNVYCSKRSIIFQRYDLKSDNQYSILPILSQVGIQSNKTLFALDQKKGKNPVFVIGYKKSSMDILGLVLSILGYRCCINRREEFSLPIENIIENNEPLLFDAYVGFKVFELHYMRLKSFYPNAIFIILKEEIDKKPHGFFIQKEKAYILSLLDHNFIRKICKFLGCIPPKISFESMNIYSDNIPCVDLNKSKTIVMDNRQAKALEHDVHPWIIPIEKLSDYGVYEYKTEAKLIGKYEKTSCETFEDFNYSNWYILEDTFPTNLSFFKKNNFSISNNEFRLTLIKERFNTERFNTREYTSASLATRKNYQYGRFEVKMKPAKGNGIISAFFLHRNDPWQEIDFEFLGNDTTKVLSNVYYNPGVDGVKYNYGNRGTPTIIDLNFDASSEFHKYSIEWEPHEVRWYVDGILIHLRATWNPTPIPDLPMQFYINLWASKSEELVGKIDDNALPKDTSLKEINIYDWLYENKE
jgi:GR25 family glycosyltransferase involved in LPS biosynthesis